MVITRIQKNGVTYRISAVGMEDAIALAKQWSDTAENFAAACAMSNQLNEHLVGLANVPAFDPTASYTVDSIIKYQPTGETRIHVYRALQAISPGTWDASKWQDTNVWMEISDMRAGISQSELIRLQIMVNNDGAIGIQTGVTTFYVSYNGQVDTYQTDENGYKEFTVPINETIIITCEAREGLYAPTPSEHLANMHERNIRITYYTHRTGWYVVDDQGLETFYTEWDTANNAHAVAVKFYNVNGHFAILKNYVTRGNTQWCVSNYQFDTDLLPNLADAACRNDWNMYANTTNIIALADGPTGYGVTNGWPINAELMTYVPAASWCRSQYIDLAGTRHFGSLPSGGVFNILSVPANRSKLDEVMQLIGGNAVGTMLASGSWWSSSQNSAANAWILILGSLNSTYRKTGGISVLPFFDF